MRLVLVQEDGGGPLGAGLGQRHERGRRNRVVVPPGNPIPPRHAPAAPAGQRLLDHRHGGQSAVAVQIDGILAVPADDHFLAAWPAEPADGDLIRGEGGQGPAAVGAEVRCTASAAPGPSIRSVAMAPRPGGVSWMT